MLLSLLLLLLVLRPTGVLAQSAIGIPSTPSNIQCKNAIQLEYGKVYEGVLSKDLFVVEINGGSSSTTTSTTTIGGRWYYIIGTGRIMTITACTNVTQVDVDIEILTRLNETNNDEFGFNIRQSSSSSVTLEETCASKLSDEFIYSNRKRTPSQHQFCGYDFKYPTGNHQVTFRSIEGEMYLIKVLERPLSAWSTNKEGPFGIIALESNVPSNNDCEDAVIIGSTYWNNPYVKIGTTTNAVNVDPTRTPTSTNGWQQFTT